MHHVPPANQLRLALEPGCLENPTATAREDPRMERTRSETLKLECSAAHSSFYLQTVDMCSEVP